MLIRFAGANLTASLGSGHFAMSTSPESNQTRDAGPHAVPIPRRIVVMAEKSWESLFLTSTLKRAGLDVVALIVDRAPTDGIAFRPLRWKQARARVGLRLSSWAFLGLPLGPGHHVRRLAFGRSAYPVLRDVQKLGIPIKRVDAFKSPECHAVLRDLRPDVMVICGTPILPESLLSIPSVCTINIHTSVLPHYRGGGSLFWPLFFRDHEKVGFTIHKAIAALDAGPFLYQERVPVAAGDTPKSLLQKCFRAAAPRLAAILAAAPLDERSWHSYPKTVSHVHRRPHPEVYRFLFGSAAVAGAKRAARHVLNGARAVLPGRHSPVGRHVAFFMHRALPDNTSRSDWRRVLGHPTVSELREKLGFLKQHFTLVSVSQWLGRLESDEPSTDRYAVLTVDDGYRDFRTGLLPVLEELNVPAAFFVCTGAIEAKTVWYQRVYDLIDAHRPDRLWVPWMDTHIYFGDVRHRVLTVERVLLAHLKRLPRSRRRELVDRLILENRVSPSGSTADAFCTLDDLKALQRSPLVELFPHSHDHDPFETLTDEELHTDLTTCRQFLADRLGIAFEVFSYPNGHFKDAQRALLSNLGIRYGFTTENGAEQGGKTDRLALRRNGLGNEKLSAYRHWLRRLNLIG
jgi:methionyl-tRNA formyltransferase/peptidoglycan/xylan/chitin deacetylase (PgdA/CDA1 family)